jgi:hypothetical protein
MQKHDEVDFILTECFITLGQNIGELKVSPAAAQFWRDRYRERFLITLQRERPRTWSHDRANVLAKAASLGRLAAELARRDRSLVIDVPHAAQASDANDCQPRSRYGEFGIWCVPPGKATSEPERAREPIPSLASLLPAVQSS